MPRIAFIDRASDKRAGRKKERERKRALSAPARRARRQAVLKALACFGLLAVFAVLGIAVGNSDYQVTLIGWVPFCMTAAGIVLAAVYAAVLRSMISFEEILAASECERDSDIAFRVRFKNRSPLLATRVKATFFIADMFDNVANESSTTLALSPFEEYELSFGARFEHIGSYHAGLKSIEIADFLGLFTKAIENTTQQVVHVTPKLVELDGIRFSDDAMDEATKAAKSVLADSMDYAYVREYEQGDPLKTIHWKLSARAGGYMTRLYEVYSNPTVAIVMDFYAPVDEATDLMSMFDAVVESAFSLARYARRQGMEVQVTFLSRYGDVREIEGMKAEAAAEVIPDLPRMSNDAADAAAALDIISSLTHATRGFNNVFICTGNVGADMASAAIEAKLNRRAPSLVAVVPPSLIGREREDWCAPLGRLDSDGIPYLIIAHSEELMMMGGA